MALTRNIDAAAADPERPDIHAKATGWRLPFRAMKPWAEPMHPVVRVRFRYKSGDAMGVRVGSGFILSSWPNVVLTAGHVVRLEGDDEQPVLIRITVWSADRTRHYVVDASAMGYPHPWSAQCDIATLLLQHSVPQLVPSLEAYAAPEGAFEAVLEGIAKTLQRREFTAVRAGPFLEYRDSRTARSMSGGPLCWKQKDGTTRRVVGAHQRGREVGSPDPAAAWALDSQWLNACLSAAEKA